MVPGLEERLLDGSEQNMGYIAELVRISSLATMTPSTKLFL
jgi:hypothetical protein